MNPVRKMNRLILTSTSTIVFTTLVTFNNYLSQHPSLMEIIDGNKILSILFATIFSVGFYNVILKLFEMLFNNFKCIKKIILGPMYLEGHWVGYFIGKNKRTRIFYETIEQDLDRIVIRGTSFNDDGSYHASWVSNNVVFNIEEGKIKYYYENDAVDNTHINPGIGSFNVKRKSSRLPATELRGYTSDLFNPEKISSIEYKIGNKEGTSTCELFEKGKKISEEYNALIEKSK